MYGNPMQHSMGGGGGGGMSSGPPGGGMMMMSQQQTGMGGQQQQKHDIFVGNLAFNTTEEQLHQVFSEVGRLVKVRMVSDLETGKPRGFAFVEFEDPQAALAAIRNLNDYELNGRRLRVNFSNSSHLETLATRLGMDMSQHTGSQRPPRSTGGDGGGTLSGAPGLVQDAGSGAGSQGVADALRTLSKMEMYDVISQLKAVADRDPDEARKLLCGHPQLPEAVLHLMSKLEMIKTPLEATDIASGLSAAGAAPPPSAQLPPPPPKPAQPSDPRIRAADPRAAAASQPPPSDPRASAASRSDPRSDPRVDPRASASNAPPPPQPPPVQGMTAPPPMPGMSVPPPPPSQMPPHPPGGPPSMPPPQPGQMQFNAPPPPMMSVPPPQQQQQQQQQQQAPGVANLDPSLVQQVMSLTPQQIAQLPPDKQQSILALRHQISGGR